MDIKDATLVFLTESGDCPSVAELARSAYDRLVQGEEVEYQMLDSIIGEASGKGVLRAMKATYGPEAFDAIVMPILQEIGHRKPIRSSRPKWHPTPGSDPLS